MDKIITALDFDSFDECKQTVEKLGDDISWYKVGLQLFLAEGEKVLDYLKEKNKNIFLDLKFFDIPNTVEKAIKSISRFKPNMTTIHALGGRDMIEKAASYIHDNKLNITLLAVTILTSVDEDCLVKDMGLKAPVENNVAHLASVASRAGAGGIVCSPKEITLVRGSTSPETVIVTPGVRMKDDSADDQKRISTPTDAIKQGASYVVMGRSLTNKSDPISVIRQIEKELNEE